MGWLLILVGAALGTIGLIAVAEPSYFTARLGRGESRLAALFARDGRTRLTGLVLLVLGIAFAVGGGPMVWI